MQFLTKMGLRAGNPSDPLKKLTPCAIIDNADVVKRIELEHIDWVNLVWNPGPIQDQPVGAGTISTPIGSQVEPGIESGVHGMTVSAIVS